MAGSALIQIKSLRRNSRTAKPRLGSVPLT